MGMHPGTDRVRAIVTWVILLFLCACGGDEDSSRVRKEPLTAIHWEADYEVTPLMEEVEIEDEEIEELEEIVLNDVVGVGGSASKAWSKKYKRRGKKTGGQARRKNLSHGGTHLTNEEPYDLQFFQTYGVNPMVDTDDDRFSTFAADVDTGSYTICRKFLTDGNLPKKEAVRVEEFVNYFDYGYAPPAEGTFAAHMEGGPSPFADNRYLLSLGLKGKVIDRLDRKNAVLTFVIDVSGSMERDDRLELVKKALRLLVDQLRPQDRIGIAVYGSQGSSLLAHQSVGEGKEAILQTIERLESGGSTNAEEGLDIGYHMADRAFQLGWINRVVLCSDGVANVGRTGPDTIFAKIKDRVKKGIFLTTVGFGMDNYNDVLMEQLGDRGNGHYAYVDDLEEARRVFVEGLTGTLQVIAREVKIQVEFNPEQVRSYRLVGYENRAVADKDFRNDQVDGGEVGAGHAVTAVYELKLWEEAAADSPLGWFRVRYMLPDYGEKAEEYVAEMQRSCLVEDSTQATDHFRLLACVTRFAEVLRKSYWAQGVSLEPAMEEARELAGRFPHDRKIGELGQLMATALEYQKLKMLEDDRQVELQKVEEGSEKPEPGV